MNIIEELEQLKIQEKDLENKLKKTDIYQKLDEVKKEKNKLLNKIDDLSFYDADELSNAILKVLFRYDNMNYTCNKEETEYSFFYPRFNHYCRGIEYKLNIYEEKYPYFNKKKRIYLRPIKDKKNINYIDKFLNYLCECRYNGNNDDIDTLTNTFLENTIEEQKLRQEEMRQEKEKIEREDLRRKFEESCNLDRKTILNILAYIISKYDNDFDAVQEIGEYINRDNAYCYHSLIIKNQNRKNKFSTIIDTERIEYDDYQRYVLNKNKNTEINFYNLKRNLPIIEDTIYAKSFMDIVEDKFEKGEKVSKDDCYNFLIEISNQKKNKQKTKRKDS